MNPSKPNRCDLDLSPGSIEPCEERLALSASLAADALLDLVSTDTAADVIEQQQIDPSESLLEQAADLRDITGFDGSGQTVAVIDSGVAYDHVSFSGDGVGIGPGYRVVGGWDFAENDADPYDDGPAGFHGTQVASLLAGDSTEQTGIAPGVDIVALRVFDDNGMGNLEYIESALQYVHENQFSFESPITTVNLSVGAALSGDNLEFAMSLLEDELELLREDGILVFAASGNFFDADSPESFDDILYPASSPSVIPVSSVDSFGDLSDFAQRTDDIFAAPGEDLVGAVPDHVFGFDGHVDDFATLSGTSQATPQLAGVSVLVRQALIAEGIEATPDAVLERLDALSSLQTDDISGLTYRTLDLAGLVGTDDINNDIADDIIDSGEASITDPPSVLNGFTGTNDSESIELDLRDGLELKVGDQTYSLSPETADATIVIDVSGGDDDLQIFGSENSERLIQYAGETGVSTLTSGNYTIEFRGFENVNFVGGGGADRATLFDSPGDDTLYSEPNAATLEGVGFRFNVEQVDRIFVHGIHGGNDVAFLQDSAGDDQLEVRPQFSSLRSDETFQLAYGFEKVYAYASNGGFDSIEINDSVGDDTLSISATRSVIAGPGYLVSANDFESTVASSTNGGNDIARIYSNSNDADSGSFEEQWEVQSDRVQWTGQDDSVRIARGFARTEAFEDFQQIELSTQSAGLPSWLVNTKDDDIKDEAETSRDIFADFGEEF